jgi:RNase P protein component
MCRPTCLGTVLATALATQLLLLFKLLERGMLRLPEACSHAGGEWMQVDYWSDRGVWKRKLQWPVEAGDAAARAVLLALLQPSKGGFMWRTSKTSVASELSIPPQSTVVQRLQLSAIERHSYRRCHKETARKAGALLPADIVVAVQSKQAITEAMDRPLTQTEADQLFPSLVRLRKVC